jgi:hypothetical protein
MLRLPGLGTRNPDILHQRFLIPSPQQRNTQIDHPFGSHDLASVAKTHFLIAFVLLKNYIRKIIKSFI